MRIFSKKLVGTAFLMMLVPVCASGQETKTENQENKVAIVAHRGYWNCEEAGYAKNSVAALRCAQQAGFWGSEFDVNMTSDEVLLVYHDSRIAGKVIDQTPYSEFKDMKLENGESIPTIDDYLAQAKKCPGTVLVYELKTHSTPQIEDRLVDLTIEKLAEYGLDSPDRVIFISFSINICKRLAKLMPGYTVQYLSDDYSPEELAAWGINGVDFHFKVFSAHPDWYSSAREHSMSVNAWTVDKESNMKKMFRLGVDMLTTDRPDLAREILMDREKKAE